MMFDLIPNSERLPENRCWFCGTNKSVKYHGKIVNPCLTAENRYIDILCCNKCVLQHDVI